MKELQDILAASGELAARGEAAALATVVQVSGSSYRRPGARMLVTQAGRVAGSVSGGCLESDVVRQAKRVLETGRAVLATYDTTQDSDVVFGVGLGCRGVIHILIERLSSEYCDFLAGAMRDRQRGVVATVIRADVASETPLAGRLCLRGEGAAVHDLTDGELADRMRQDACEALRSGVSQVRSYGTVEVFVELIEPPTPLVLFGAGPDAAPLVRLAWELGWHVTVVDERPEAANPARFPLADTVTACAAEAVPERIALDARTVAVLLTHNYLQDLRLLEALLPVPLRYLGILGPKRRTEQMLADLRARGLAPTDEWLDCLHSPAGLDIGADAPEQIALAIVAEINATLAGRSGGPLRERSGPIYPTAESASCPISDS